MFKGLLPLKYKMLSPYPSVLFRLVYSVSIGRCIIYISQESSIDLLISVNAVYAVTLFL